MLQTMHTKTQDSVRSSQMILTKTQDSERVSQMTMVRFLLPGWNAYFATDVFWGEKAIQCDFISHFSAPPYITTHLLQTSDNGTRETTCESISKRRTQAHYVSNSADDKRRMSNRARIAQLRKADPRQLFPFNSAR